MACPITAVNLALPEGEWSHGPAATVCKALCCPQRGVPGAAWRGYVKNPLCGWIIREPFITIA